MATDSDTWRTAIAEVQGTEVLIRGYRLSDLVGHISYSESVFLVLTGELPTAQQRDMLDAILVSVIEHGISPSSIIARTLASCGTPVQASVAGAMLSIADWHGGSGEQVAQVMAPAVAAARVADDPDAALRTEAEAIVHASRERRERLEGFGHPQHTDGDPRARMLIATAERLGVAGDHVQLLKYMQDSIRAELGRPLLANVTGALAAVLLDLGIPAAAVRGIVIGARAPGLVAHVVEELEQGGRWRHAPASSVTYTGPPDRPVPIRRSNSSRRK